VRFGAEGGGQARLATSGGLDATARYEVKAGVIAEANTSVGGVDIRQTALAGGRADVSGALRAGARGVEAEVGAGAFAGLEESTRLSTSLFDGLVKVELEGGVSEGIGAEARISGSLRTDRIGLRESVGLAYGPGARGSVAITVDAAELAERVANSAPGRAIGETTTGIGILAGDAADAVATKASEAQVAVGRFFNAILP
jgi:hypothetical protein